MKPNCYYQIDDNRLQAMQLDSDSIKLIMDTRNLVQKDGINRLCILITENGERIKLKVERIILIS